MFFTKDILEIVDICKKNPSVEAIKLLAGYYECSENRVHMILSKYLPTYKSLFRNLGPLSKKMRMMELEGKLKDRPSCPFCGSDYPKSTRKYWRCVTCKRGWRKKGAWSYNKEQSAEERLKDIEKVRRERLRKFKDALNLRRVSRLPIGRPSTITSEIVNRIFELREQGLSYEEIGKLVGLCGTTCWKVARGLPANYKQISPYQNKKEVLEEILKILEENGEQEVESISKILKGNGLKVGINRLREILNKSNGRELVERRVEKGKKLYSRAIG